MKSEEEGSFTIEATCVVSFFCLILWVVLILGFYCYDYAVLQMTSDELSLSAGLWAGRAVHPGTGEVDYTRLKNEVEPDWTDVKSKGMMMLESRLIFAKAETIVITEGLSEDAVNVRIQAYFRMFQREIPCRVESCSKIIHSKELPRKKGKAEVSLENGT